jgi:hypothetical protein
MTTMTTTTPTATATTIRPPQSQQSQQPQQLQLLHKQSPPREEKKSKVAFHWFALIVECLGCQILGAQFLAPSLKQWRTHAQL